MKKQQKTKRTSTGTGASITVPMTLVFLCKSARGFGLGASTLQILALGHWAPERRQCLRFFLFFFRQ